MRLEFRHFRASDFAEYAAWFTDPELNRWLGPMSAEWLDAVLFGGASGGATWAVFSGETLVAVAETALHPDDRSWAAITGLAVKSGFRGTGLGRAVLGEVLAAGRQAGRLEHLAYIHQDNRSARRCFERAGFAPATPTPTEEGYLEFRHTARQALEPARV